jgi:Na+/proline symporter
VNVQMTVGVRWLAGITAILVLIQAFLIGQALFLGNSGALELHGLLGSVSLIGALIFTGLAFYGSRRGEVPGLLLGLAVVVTVLLIAQLGLGYSGRRGGIPAALHIPNGVLIMGLLTAALTTAIAAPTRASDARR